MAEQSVVTRAANAGEMQLFEPPDSLLAVPAAEHKTPGSFRKAAEILMDDMSKCERLVRRPPPPNHES